MKKTIIITILALVVFACHRKTVASVPSENETTKPNAARSAMIAQGKTVYIAKCGRCHGLKNTAKYTPERWTTILQKMIPKAKLDESEAEQVTAYVIANAKQ